MQKKDPVLAVIRGWMDGGENAPSLAKIITEDEAVKVHWFQREQLYLREDVVYRRTVEGGKQLLIPRVLRENFIKTAHTGITGGHLGVKRTKHQVRRRAYWVGWARDVKEYCRRCPQCCKYQRGTPPKQGPLQPIPCGEPWERLSIDVTGPHPKGRAGNVYILTMIDMFTKYVEVVPMPNQEAVTVAKALAEAVVVLYGTPLQIPSDQGRNFEGQVFTEMCRVLEVDKVRTSTYHPQCNWMIERFHRTLNAMLGKVVEESGTGICAAVRRRCLPSYPPRCDRVLPELPPVCQRKPRAVGPDVRASAEPCGRTGELCRLCDTASGEVPRCLRHRPSEAEKGGRAQETKVRPAGKTGRFQKERPCLLLESATIRWSHSEVATEFPGSIQGAGTVRASQLPHPKVSAG